MAELYVAKASYRARSDEELSFNEGDVIAILEKTSGDYWKGEVIITRVTFNVVLDGR